MQIAIYNRTFDEEDISLFQQLVTLFVENNITAVFYEDLANRLHSKIEMPLKYEVFSDIQPLSAKVKFVFSLGGDGTMLDIVKHVGD
jgi:NAD+ kinase